MQQTHHSTFHHLHEGSGNGDAFAQILLLPPRCVMKGSNTAVTPSMNNGKRQRYIDAVYRESQVMYPIRL